MAQQFDDYAGDHTYHMHNIILEKLARLDNTEWHTFDKDEENDGKINFDDFRAIFHTELNAEHPTLSDEALRNFFGDFDHNNDNHIDLKEFHDAKDVQKSLMEEVDLFLDIFDKDRDGMDQAEFQDAVAKAHGLVGVDWDPEAGQADLNAAFDDFDDDNDGLLDVQERRIMMDAMRNKGDLGDGKKWNDPRYRGIQIVGQAQNQIRNAHLGDARYNLDGSRRTKEEIAMLGQQRVTVVYKVLQPSVTVYKTKDRSKGPAGTLKRGQFVVAQRTRGQAAEPIGQGDRFIKISEVGPPFNGGDDQDNMNAFARGSQLYGWVEVMSNDQQKSLNLRQVYPRQNTGLGQKALYKVKVTIRGATGLMNLDGGGGFGLDKSDPYVEVKFSREGGQEETRGVTTIVQNNLNPKWEKKDMVFEDYFESPEDINKISFAVMDDDQGDAEQMGALKSRLYKPLGVYNEPLGYAYLGDLIGADSGETLWSFKNSWSSLWGCVFNNAKIDLCDELPEQPGQGTASPDRGFLSVDVEIQIKQPQFTRWEQLPARFNASLTSKIDALRGYVNAASGSGKHKFFAQRGALTAALDMLKSGSPSSGLQGCARAASLALREIVEKLCKSGYGERLLIPEATASVGSLVQLMLEKCLQYADLNKGEPATKLFRHICQFVGNAGVGNDDTNAVTLLRDVINPMMEQSKSAVGREMVYSGLRALISKDADPATRSQEFKDELGHAAAIIKAQASRDGMSEDQNVKDAMNRTIMRFKRQGYVAAFEKAQGEPPTLNEADMADDQISTIHSLNYRGMILDPHHAYSGPEQEEGPTGDALTRFRVPLSNMKEGWVKDSYASKTDFAKRIIQHQKEPKIGVFDTILAQLETAQANQEFVLQGLEYTMSVHDAHGDGILEVAFTGATTLKQAQLFKRLVKNLIEITPNENVVLFEIVPGNWECGEVLNTAMGPKNTFNGVFSVMRLGPNHNTERPLDIEAYKIVQAKAELKVTIESVNSLVQGKLSDRTWQMQGMGWKRWTLEPMVFSKIAFQEGKGKGHDTKNTIPIPETELKGTSDYRFKSEDMNEHNFQTDSKPETLQIVVLDDDYIGIRDKVSTTQKMHIQGSASTFLGQFMIQEDQLDKLWVPSFQAGAGKQYLNQRLSAHQHGQNENLAPNASVTFWVSATVVPTDDVAEYIPQDDGVVTPRGSVVTTFVPGKWDYTDPRYMRAEKVNIGKPYKSTAGNAAWRKNFLQGVPKDRKKLPGQVNALRLSDWKRFNAIAVIDQGRGFEVSPTSEDAGEHQEQKPSIVVPRLEGPNLQALHVALSKSDRAGENPHGTAGKWLVTHILDEAVGIPSFTKDNFDLAVKNFINTAPQDTKNLSFIIKELRQNFNGGTKTTPDAAWLQTYFGNRPKLMQTLGLHQRQLNNGSYDTHPSLGFAIIIKAVLNMNNSNATPPQRAAAAALSESCQNSGKAKATQYIQQNFEAIPKSQQAQTAQSITKPQTISSASQAIKTAFPSFCLQQLEQVLVMNPGTTGACEAAVNAVKEMLKPYLPPTRPSLVITAQHQQTDYVMARLTRIGCWRAKTMRDEIAIVLADMDQSSGMGAHSNSEKWQMFYGRVKRRTDGGLARDVTEAIRQLANQRIEVTIASKIFRGPMHFKAGGVQDGDDKLCWGEFLQEMEEAQIPDTMLKDFFRTADANRNGQLDVGDFDASQWGPFEVMRYFQEAGFPQEAELFRAQQIEGRHLPELDQGDLKAMGIRRLGTRRKIMKEIQNFVTKMNVFQTEKKQRDLDTRRRRELNNDVAYDDFDSYYDDLPESKSPEQPTAVEGQQAGWLSSFTSLLGF